MITELCGNLRFSSKLYLLIHLESSPFCSCFYQETFQSPPNTNPEDTAMSNSPSSSRSSLSRPCPSTPLLQTAGPVPHLAPGTHEAQPGPAPKGAQQLAGLSARLQEGGEASVGRGAPGGISPARHLLPWPGDLKGGCRRWGAGKQGSFAKPHTAPTL